MYNDLDLLLDAVVQKQLKSAMAGMSKQIASLAREYIHSEFYDQYSPTKYIRTYQLIKSVTSLSPVVSGNSVTIEIKLDPSGKFYKSDSAETVFALASEGKHGSSTIQTGGRFWDATVKDVIKNWREYLISNGFTVAK